MVKIARTGRNQVAPLNAVSLELIQQDIDNIYQVMANGIGTDYLDPDVMNDVGDGQMGVQRTPRISTLETTRVTEYVTLQIQSDGVTG